MFLSDLRILKDEERGKKRGKECVDILVLRGRMLGSGLIIRFITRYINYIDCISYISCVSYINYVNYA